MSNQHELTDKLIKFLKSYYRDEIGELAQHYPREQRSLNVDWMELYQFDPELAEDLLDDPAQMIEYFEEALRLVDLPVDVKLSNAHVRVNNLPEMSSNDPETASRHDHIGKMLAVEGQVSKVTKPKPRVVEAAWECQRCGTMTYIPQAGDELQDPHECQGCERQGPFRLNSSQSEWTDHQYARLQEPPEKSGGNGATIDCHLEDDLIKEFDAGDRVTVAGQLEIEDMDSGDDLDATTHLKANSISREESSYEDIEIDEHIEEITAIANGEYGDPFDLWTDSINPAHHGDETIKLALTMQLFGGWSRGSRRGDSHVLLMGDPGCGKSTFLEWIDDLAPRSTYVSGKGASTAGLTAGAVSDDFGDTEWSLEAGALVIADQGIACVDELDKVDEEAVSSLHGALESQKVHVQKVVKATLSCRTSLLAAGNPKYGRFDHYQPIGEQIDLSPTLMSRFDLMFMVSDQPDIETDGEIVDHKVTASRAAAKKELGEELSEEEEKSIQPAIPREVMRAYIAYAKEEVKPYIREGSPAEDRLREGFLELRMANKDQDDSPVPVTFRKQEAIERVAEASARVRLSNEVTVQDVDRALDLVTESMQQVGVDPESGQFDTDIVETGTSKTQRNRIQKIKSYIEENDAPDAQEISDELSIPLSKVEHEIEKLLNKGEIYDRNTNGEYMAT